MGHNELTIISAPWSIDGKWQGNIFGWVLVP